MKLFKIFLILIISFGTYSSCSKKCVGEPLTVDTTSLELEFRESATGNYLIKPINGRYNKDDITITSTDNTPRPYKITEHIIAGERINRISLQSLFVIGDDEKMEVCKRLYISFKNDQDTLDYCFKVKDFACNSSGFEYLKLKYNGKDAGIKENNNTFEFQINK